MTVQELIDRLSLIEDKTFEIIIEADRTFIDNQKDRPTVCFGVYDVQLQEDEQPVIIAE